MLHVRDATHDLLEKSGNTAYTQLKSAYMVSMRELNTTREELQKTEYVLAPPRLRVLTVDFLRCERAVVTLGVY